ncbi:MAG: glycosyltransferase family 4 protein [Planctomycetaceae bacterium]
MKTLFLDHGTTLGGGQVMAARLLPLLRDRGFDIDLLAGCVELGGGAIPTGYRGLRRAMRGYDLIYANTPRTALAAATTGIPFVWHKHSVPLTWATRLAARRARAVIAVSRAAAPEGRNVHVVPNGVPSLQAPPASDLPPGRKILLLGRVHHEKGHDLALEALDLMRETATLVVAGPGVWPHAPREKVRILGPRSDVAALLAACDLLVLPSRAPEACPLAVLEAQAAGLPVVAADVGGVAEIVQEGVTAYLVPPEDPRRLALALDRALNADRAAWARHARAHAKRFTLEGCADAIGRILSDCLAPARQGDQVQAHP